MPKNTFFEGKKIFLYKKFLGTFYTCTIVACAKKTLSETMEPFGFSSQKHQKS